MSQQFNSKATGKLKKSIMKIKRVAKKEKQATLDADEWKIRDSNIVGYEAPEIIDVTDDNGNGGGVVGGSAGGMNKILRNLKPTSALTSEPKTSNSAASTTHHTLKGSRRSNVIKTILDPILQSSIDQGKADSSRPFAATLQNIDGSGSGAPSLPVWPIGIGPGVSMPLRPDWNATDNLQTLDKREVKYFEVWNEALSHRCEEMNHILSPYEKNLNVWRQLWRVTEISDCLLVIVDIRTPVLSFPAPLYKYATSKDANIPVILLLNKADLLPKRAVELWAKWFEVNFPLLSKVLPFRADPGVRKSESNTRSGQSRWSSVHKPECKSDVDALFDVIKSVKVNRGGGISTFGEYWNRPAPSAEKGKDFTASTRTATSKRESSPFLTLGVVGEPNQGKSSVLNRLFASPKTRSSQTPGCTKILQTHHLNPCIRLCDCPGLIFPKVNLPNGLGVLSGGAPISQCRDPFSPIRFVVEYGCFPSIAEAYSLKSIAEYNRDLRSTPFNTTSGGQNLNHTTHWSPFSICEALAIKNLYLVDKGAGRCDVMRGGNRILRDILSGRVLRIGFLPPDTVEIVSWGELGSGNGGIAREDFEEDEEDDEEDEGGTNNRLEFRDDGSDSDDEGDEGDAKVKVKSATNGFAGLMMDSSSEEEEEGGD